MPSGPGAAAPACLHFFAEPMLCGTVLWGSPDEAAVQTLARLIDLELSQRSPPHRAFVARRASAA